LKQVSAEDHAREPAGVRVGINCLRIYPGYKGGVNSFTFGLLDGFSRVGERHEFSLFVTPWNRELFEVYGRVANFDIVEIDESDHSLLRAVHDRIPLRIRRRLPRGAPGIYGSQYAELMERAADVFYVPYVPPPRLFPFPDAPTVYSIHDLQHVHYPEFFTAEELVEREAAFTRCVAHATVVQASSRSMCRDFCDHFPKLDESNVEVIPEGVDVELFSSENGVAVRAKYRLPETFAFTPAQLWPHKNHLTTLRALARLKERGTVVPLVLTGAEYDGAKGVFDFIDRHGLGGQVSYLRVVPWEDIVALHQQASLLVTASLFESSSLPILEAAAAGTPIVASRIAAHKEMAERLEMRLFEPLDDAELADVLAEAWLDEQTNAAQVAANREGVRGYSWESAATRYLRLFERLETRDSLLVGGRS
jgi:glycosyltransferase involved in cell wall biosynthesis